MTEQQRNQQSIWISKHPTLFLIMIYSVGFTSCTMILNVMQLAGIEVPGKLKPYYFPLCLVLPYWLGLRKKAMLNAANLENEAASES